MALQNTNVAMSDGGGRGSKNTFNIAASKQLVKDIADTYKEMGDFIFTRWENVLNVLQKNWIGVDEQNFEKTFAAKVNNLYDVSTSVMQNTAKVIAAIANAYLKAQSQNTFEGQTELDVSSLGMAYGDIDIGMGFAPNIVAERPRQITPDMDLGLTSPSADTNIKNEINNYVTRIKNNTENLFNKCANGVNQFISEEEVKEKLKQMIKAAGNLMADINISIKDMYKAIDELVTKQYGNVASSVVSELEELTSSIKNTDIGESRWN